ncbi:MAG: hypothetical protein A2Z24_00845 [Candidatus Woykebacteria bacterium RBG_16_44_10]|uniref:Uncharacterized protein n=1 Tax=Candidatus Woykebacteria bacterium RBG_16_44_10 TaxID=1802597 RepID=A0A1G1WFM3_9BACT|nr:MAG: hypothetical protein A2Z24_00845 [Candidatus Woykebacteria bacterium RBG_16_44_10]
MNTRAIIVIPKSAQLAANTAAQNWDEAASEEDLNGAAKTFTAGLSPSGSLPVTHYIASTVLPVRKMLRLRNRLENLPPAIKWVILKVPDPQGRVADSNLTGVSVNQIYDADQMLVGLGLKTIIEL